MDVYELRDAASGSQPDINCLDGNVALPYSGYDPRLVIDTIWGPLGFIRGDADGDGKVGLADAITILLFIFGRRPPEALDASDVNDSATVTLADVIYLLRHVFAAGPPPPPPFPDPGPDPTP